VQGEESSLDKRNSCARIDVGQILGTLRRRKGIEIIEAQCMPDHVYMLVRIPPKYSVSEIMGYADKRGLRIRPDVVSRVYRPVYG
jgi:REP element-mobilizing transposase RayT